MALTPFSTSRKGKQRSVIPPTQGPIEKFGVLQPQEVLLGLFGEYVSLEERAWSGGLVQLLGDLGFSGAASRVAMNRVIARGLLAPEKEGRFVFYSITPRLKIVHDEGRHQTFSPAADVQWSGDWTLVWYNIPEEQRLQRARLGRWLNLRGFGALQDGTWICAGNSEMEVIELARRLELEKFVIVFVGRLGEGIDVRATAERAWRLAELSRMYEIFVREFRPYLSAAGREKVDRREAFIIRTRLIEMFRQTTTQDPRLPDAVLGLKWKRREAVEIFQELQQTLAPDASAYFRGVAVTGHHAD